MTSDQALQVIAVYRCRRNPTTKLSLKTCVARINHRGDNWDYYHLQILEECAGCIGPLPADETQEFVTISRSVDGSRPVYKSKTPKPKGPLGRPKVAYRCRFLDCDEKDPDMFYPRVKYLCRKHYCEVKRGLNNAYYAKKKEEKNA